MGLTKEQQLRADVYRLRDSVARYLERRGRVAAELARIDAHVLDEIAMLGRMVDTIFPRAAWDAAPPVPVEPER